VNTFISPKEPPIKENLNNIYLTPNKIREINYKAKKREFIDSLIDNKILTPQNLEKAEDLYPDSLCHC